MRRPASTYPCTSAAQFMPIPLQLYQGFPRFSRPKCRAPAAQPRALRRLQVTTEGGGGFASVRALLPASVPRSWASSSGLVLTCAGDGRAGYKICVKADAGMDGVMYQASLPAVSTEMTTVRLPWSAFKPTFRGMPVRDAPIRGDQVQQLGFMLSRFESASGAVMADVPAGRFQLRLGQVGSY